MQQPQLAFGKSSSDSRGESMSSIVIDKAAISLFSTNKDDQDTSSSKKKQVVNKSTLFTNSQTISLVNNNSNFQDKKRSLHQRH